MTSRKIKALQGLSYSDSEKLKNLPDASAEGQRIDHDMPDMSGAEEIEAQRVRSPEPESHWYDSIGDAIGSLLGGTADGIDSLTKEPPRGKPRRPGYTARGQR